MRLFALLLLDSVLLQPLRCMLGFVLRFCWHPPRRVYPANGGDTPRLFSSVAELYERLDRNVYGRGGDTAKFLGMLYYAGGKDEDWSRIRELILPDGALKRSLREPTADAPVFSGDMLSGFLLAVYRRLPLLDDGDRALLGAVWDRATWRGWPLLFPHPVTGKRLGDRGHIWRPWWIMGSEDILTAMAWLYLGYQVTGRKRYLAAYHAFRLLQAPSLILACADAQLWIGGVYAIAPHNTHSKVLGWYVGYRLTGSVFFRRALAQAYKRHGDYNADICLLAGSVINAPWHLLHGTALATDALSKGRYPCPQDRRYLSVIWPPEMVTRSAKIELPSSRGGDYVWERNPVKGVELSDEKRQSLGLDVIFPAMLLLDKEMFR